MILHMVGNLLKGNKGAGIVILRAFSESGSQGRNDQKWATWRQSPPDGDVYVRFEIRMSDSGPQPEGAISTAVHAAGRRYTSEGIQEGLSFTICKKLVQVGMVNCVYVYLFMYAYIYIFLL